MKYTTPEIEMMELDVVDVITGSFETDDDDPTTPPPEVIDPDGLPVG